MGFEELSEYFQELEMLICALSLVWEGKTFCLFSAHSRRPLGTNSHHFQLVLADLSLGVKRIKLGSGHLPLSHYLLPVRVYGHSPRVFLIDIQ